MVAIARLPRFTVPTEWVTVIVGGSLLMLDAIELARAAIASPDCLISGATISVKMFSAADTSSENDTSLLIPISIAHAYGWRYSLLPCPALDRAKKPLFSHKTIYLVFRQR